jgi:hypothetical protein
VLVDGAPARSDRRLLSARQARRGYSIAIVACARKLACLFWCLLTRDEDYAFAQPSLTKKKMRRLEIQAGAQRYRGGRGVWSTNDAMRDAERELALQAQRAYERTIKDRQQLDSSSPAPAPSLPPARRAWRRRRTRARCVTSAGVICAAAGRRRIGTVSATDTPRWGVYSAVRRLFALMARDTRRESGATGADRTHAGCRSRAYPGRGILGCVRPVSHGAPSPQHITERVARDTPRARRCETPAQRVVGVRIQRP